MSPLTPDPMTLTEMEDENFHMTQEEEADYWNGIGSVKFLVMSNRPDVFEIDILEYDGCVQGLEEAIGIEFAIKEGYLGNPPYTRYPEGYVIHIFGVKPEWIRGDGWTTDDDVEYYHEGTKYEFHLRPWFQTKIWNFVWFTLYGWKWLRWLP